MLGDQCPPQPRLKAPTLANSPYGLPGKDLKSANRLLQQQFWLWGCDIRRQEGNLLSQLGFEKIKAPPESGLTTSQYNCPLSPTRSIALWGFGMCLGCDIGGSIFVPRSGLRPRYSATPVCTASAWEAAWFDRLPLPASPREVTGCHHLLGEAIDWIVWYEHRVLAIAGEGYRQRSIDTWPRAVCPADQIAIRWEQLGSGIRQAQPEMRIATS
jgi:hypothetical protein